MRSLLRLAVLRRLATATPAWVLGLAFLVAGPAFATSFTAPMDGPTEVPPVDTPATGFATVTVTGVILSVDLSFSGLIGGPATAASIHCCVSAGGNALVAVILPSFPAATSGTYEHDFDLTDAATYNPSFLNNAGGTAAAASAALLAGLEADQAYVNIHDTEFPGGEIRGNLAPVPEPSTLTFVAVALAATAAVRRHRPR
jgi:hypothetical protein